MSAVGFTLQPELRYLELLDEVIRELPDYYEVTPETLWFGRSDGTVRPNAFCERFLELGRETQRPFVAHGVGLSIGTLDSRDEERFATALERIREQHERFEFQWYTDHLGASVLGQQNLIMPMAVPFTPDVAQHVRARLLRLREVVGLAGVENTVTYFNLSPALREPNFLRSALDEEGLVLLLDLHNLYTMAQNFGFSEAEYIEQLPLERVIEIHVSGGSMSDPAWLPEGRQLRLDSHDGRVPEPVWQLLEDVLPRCENLRGVTLERMEGTVNEADVAVIRAELLRLKELCK